MTIRKHLAVALAVVAVLAGAACGGDDDDDAGSASDGDSYCDAVEAFFDLTQSLDFGDEPDPVTMIANFEAMAEAQRAAADAAPDEVQEAHEQLANASEELVDELQEADPQTAEEFDEAGEEITNSLTEEYGDLEAETAAVTTFAEEECGVGIEGDDDDE